MTAENGTAQAAVSCIIATTPWSGSTLLCRALRETGLAGNPRDYFNPRDVPWRSWQWGLRGSEPDFAPRYLKAVTGSAVGGNGALSINLPWSHQRWLVRFARAAAPDPEGTAVRSDARVLEQWFPGIRYVYLSRADKARQAAHWYLMRRTGTRNVGAAPRPDHPPDFAEVRWIEELISSQERAWETYFQVHDIDAYWIEYEDFLEQPEETVARILAWLRLTGPPAQQRRGEAHRQRLAAAADWQPDYLAERERLSGTIGVRRGQD